MKKYLIFLFILLLGVLTGCNNAYGKHAFYEVEKLQKTDYKKVLGSQYSNIEIDPTFKDALLDFSYKTASDLLEGRNGMYSPLSFYIALSELAELTANETREEVLNALFVDDIETLREGNQNLYKKLTYKNSISTFSIANSIWLSKNRVYNDQSLEVLRDKYYASSYGVDFSSTDDKKAIGKWVSDNTGGKLGENDFNDLDATVVFVLLNAVYFYDEWKEKFDKKLNKFDTFFGLDKQVEYMNQQLDGSYFKSDEYEMSSLRFKNGFEIKFVAPYTSVNFEEFVKDGTKVRESLSRKIISNYLVNYRIPKYTYKSSFNFVEYAQSMGINRVFGVADFSPLTNDGVFVDKMYQKTFIEIDEEGGKAAAYTGIVGNESVEVTEIVDFNLNRPFIYAIYSADIPLFIGVVCDPSSNAEEKY